MGPRRSGTQGGRLRFPLDKHPQNQISFCTSSAPTLPSCYPGRNLHPPPPIASRLEGKRGFVRAAHTDGVVAAPAL